MGSRLKLHEKLKTILGNENVYFQPPPSLNMKYPAIRYSLADIRTDAADNINYYKKVKRYTVILIHKNPDNERVDTLIENNFSFDRFYTSDGLNHYVFTYYDKGE